MDSGGRISLMMLGYRVSTIILSMLRKVIEDIESLNDLLKA
ncbi:hypothetical protein [Caldivirga sp. UBA161]|nr:hypothetical protein [Caldivirga sp. UBA161]